MSTLCLGATELDATALCVQLSLVDVQFEQGDPLSQPTYPMVIY
jgi:hypothetical protein